MAQPIWGMLKFLRSRRLTIKSRHKLHEPEMLAATLFNDAMKRLRG